MSEYIGNRIVPHHDGVWDKAKEYEPLTIVYEESTGDSYMSRKPVPAGTLLSQEEYWAMCSRFSEQMALYRQNTAEEVEQFRKDTAADVERLRTDTASDVAVLRKMTAQDVADITQKVDAANSAVAASKSEMDKTAEMLKAQINANVKASMDKNANYAQELVDARVDDEGKTYPTAGDNIRAVGRVRSMQNIMKNWVIKNGYANQNGNLVASESWRVAHMVPVSGDEAKSGTNREHREEFNRMIKDAMDGKLDYIVTKSISRFARNTIDSLTCTRELRQLKPPVGIYFEKENIDTLDAKGELILTILSALAQDESRSISDNIRWSIQKKFQSGVPHINLKRMLGYELGANKQWVIVPEQAEIIRYIFDRFVKGQTANKIALELNQMEKFTVNGKKWSASSILIVLRNEKYVGDIEMQKTITKDFLTHRSSINKGEAPRYYVKNHHVGIIDRVTWDKVQTMLFEKPRADMTKGPGKKKVKSIKGSPFGNLRCGAILENGPDAGKPCGEGFFRTTYTGVANGYSDERSLKATGEDTGEYLEKYTYSYPVWRCKRKVGERDGEPPKNGSPDQKAYCRSKKGCMSDEEKEAANKRCPSERYHECALEQSFMELLYSMKRDFEQHGDASMIVAMFDNAYEQAVRLANNNSISVQRMATVENQIKEMEERLQDAISHQVAALREAALEQNVELNEALSNGEVTIDDIDLDIRSGLTPGSIGVSFYGTETEEGSEAQIYTELVNDLQERLKTLQQERQTIEEEQGVLAIMKKNFEYFLACLKELPDTNAGGMPLRVNGLDVQGTLLRDVDGNAIEGRKRAITSGKLKLTPERIAEAPDMLHFEKGIYCAFVESGVLQGDVATYKTNFGVTLTSKGNRRTLDSFMGYKRSDMDGNVVYVDAPYKVYGFSIQYRRYLTTAAKREREEAV